MSRRLMIVVPTVALSLILTFAPVFGQDAGSRQGTTDADRSGVRAADDNRPDWGWLGLVGLIGLGGLTRRDRGDRHTDRHANK